MIEAVPLVGYDERNNTLRLQNFTAIVQEPEQIGKMFDDMARNDPVVAIGATDELRNPLATPDKIDLLDALDVDVELPEFLAESVGIHVVENFDFETCTPRSNGIVGRADLESEAVAIDVGQGFFYTAERVMPRAVFGGVRSFDGGTLPGSDRDRSMARILAGL